MIHKHSHDEALMNLVTNSTAGRVVFFTFSYRVKG